MGQNELWPNKVRICCNEGNIGILWRRRIKEGRYTRPLSHFSTRCSAATMLRVTSLESQGYTGDVSFPGFGYRLWGMGNPFHIRSLKGMNSFTLPRKFLHNSLYFAIYLYKSALSNNSQSLNDATGFRTYALSSKRSFHFLYGPRRLTPEMFQ
jgi:hypothetical protein